MQCKAVAAHSDKGVVLRLTQSEQQFISLATTASGSEDRCTRITILHSAYCGAAIDFLNRSPQEWTLTQPRNRRTLRQFGGSIIHERTVAFRGGASRCDRAPSSPSIAPLTGTISGTIMGTITFA
jgi:hypothetical protein